MARYLRPLCFDAGEAGFTDDYRVFVVKASVTGGGRTMFRREQGDAISAEYDSVASQLGRSPSSLPRRPSSRRLPDLAAQHFGHRLIADLEAIDAPLVITLGREAWQTLVQLPELVAQPPTPDFVDLYGDPYGSRGSPRVNGRKVEWLPLVHPGLLKGRPDAQATIDPGHRSVAGWNLLHSRWADQHVDDTSR